MVSPRQQRQIDSLLDEAEAAIRTGDWPIVRQRTAAVLALDPGNVDAVAYQAAADRASTASGSPAASASSPNVTTTVQPASFANGRYEVRRFLGEGGKKKVYLAHDTLLDRDVAFALIKTEGLDDVGKERITREAQAMGRLGDHPNIVTVYDIGVEQGAGNTEHGSDSGPVPGPLTPVPYLVLPLLPGGDIEGLIEKAPEHRLPIEQAIKLGIETCEGLAFAHSKGIVHRDLKPGNVWLDEAGRAKIGDFGLAVAVDRSRLTRAGMMVGTVSYMPPEQAMGGEVTARSDLYSLGAMLYEMVCGRPPFVGDESVAIIGQHLNTPPVAPSWHRPDCPPTLEALILRLLEKDPSRRPASAREAGEALALALQTLPPPPGTLTRPAATLSQGAREGSDPASPSPSTERGNEGVRSDPLYRRVFVGRESELKQLQSAFDAALSGQGGIVMVVGEPGIGKTALCEQLMTYVAMRGGRALAGHCYEEGSLSLPYLAFVEAMRSYVLAREPDALRSELGTGAAEVARIVSEVRDRTGVELRPAGDPEDDRWRLLQAVTSFLRSASTVQPLLILLEDLHWADRGTLDLLLHVARNLQGARLLIVGNYRDVEVDRAHPLSGALADLRRAGSFHTMRLRGLSIDEVQRMMTNIRGQDVPVSRAELIHRQTEGNPLFVQEVLRYLVEEGITVRQDGRYQLANPDQPEAGIPEGLRDVIGKRLSRLSPECNRLLAVAAVIGRDFDLATLRTVANVGEEQLIDAIEEAVRIGVLEERSRPGAVLYRFAHAFFRQTLYEEMIAPRRLRLHQEVARALETQYGSRKQEHAAEMAEHFSQSTEPGDLTKAVAYGRLAAERATSVFAFAEAAKYLRRCLEVQEVLDPDDSGTRCDLLLDLGDALGDTANPKLVLDVVAPEAFDLAQKTGDKGRASRACQIALESLFLIGSVGAIWTTPEARQWSEQADSLALPNTRERVRADIALSRVARFLSPEEVEIRRQRALELARRLDDNAAVWEAGWTKLPVVAWIGSPDDMMAIAKELMARPTEGVGLHILQPALYTLVSTLLSLGDRAAAERVAAEYAAMAERTSQPNIELNCLHIALAQNVLQGRFEEAKQLAEEIVALSESLDLVEFSYGPWYGIIVRLARFLGSHQLPARVAASLMNPAASWANLRPFMAHC